MKINVNIGSLDRALRILAGMALFVLGFQGYLGGLSWVGIAAGGILLLTAVFSFCPIYAVLKLKTTGKAEE